MLTIEWMLNSICPLPGIIVGTAELEGHLLMVPDLERCTLTTMADFHVVLTGLSLSGKGKHLI